MKPYFLLFALLFCKAVIGQTQSEIVRLKIYRIDKATQFLSKPAFFFTTYYDSAGRAIKEIERCDYDSSITTTETQYLTDSLISKMSVDTLVGNEHLGTTVITYHYKFDDDKKVVENTSLSSTGKQTKELYVYNTLGRIDTAFVYTNDTTTWTNNSFIGQKQVKQTMSLRRIRKYMYEDNKVIVEECCYPYETNCCETTETITTDTLEVYTSKSWGMQGHILDSAQTVWTYKIHKRNGLEYYIEQASGDKSYSTFKLNKEGLIVRQMTKTIGQDERKHNTTTDYQYYFRQ